jgi:FMN phosphatase YigB (HAD superfamily)
MIPPNVSTVLFDVGNTLNHLDHAPVAEIVGRPEAR